MVDIAYDISCPSCEEMAKEIRDGESCIWDCLADIWDYVVDIGKLELDLALVKMENHILKSANLMFEDDLCASRAFALGQAKVAYEALNPQSCIEEALTTKPIRVPKVGEIVQTAKSYDTNAVYSWREVKVTKVEYYEERPWGFRIYCGPQNLPYDSGEYGEFWQYIEDKDQ